MEVPDWLTKEYMRKALENGKNYTVTIEDMEIDMPVPKGNNYATDIYGVKVHYRRSNDSNVLRQKSFILKVPIEGPLLNDVLGAHVYKREPAVYNKILPKLRDVLGENDQENDDGEIEKDDYLLARSYFSSKEKIVILEDLKIKGYRMVNRLNQLDYEHCEVALKALAKFHAVSVVLHEKDPKLIEENGKPLLFCDDHKELFSGFVGPHFKLAGEHLRVYPEFEKYSNWFEENHEKAWDTIVDELKCKENDFNVLNHGDFWLTNMLFKYNGDNRPIKNVPIDLQCCLYSSPAVDFIYFVESSSQDEVRNGKFGDLVDLYLNDLNSNLRLYGSKKRLEQSEFMRLISRLRYFRIYVNVGVLPGILADPNKTKLLDLKDISLDDMKNSENHPMTGYFKNENYLKLLANRMEGFGKTGVITL